MLLVLLVVASGCTGIRATGDGGFIEGDGQIIRIEPADRGDPLDLKGEDLKGRPVDLADYRGKPLVINIWGSWCGPCTAEAPRLVGAAKDLTGTAAFLGITNRETDTPNPLAFERDYGIPYPSVFDPAGVALLAFRGESTPTSAPNTIVLDAQGRYAATYAGEVTSQSTLVGLVDDIAAGK